jgi:hypothetical protein
MVALLKMVTATAERQFVFMFLTNVAGLDLMTNQPYGGQGSS